MISSVNNGFLQFCLSINAPYHPTDLFELINMKINYTSLNGDSEIMKDRFKQTFHQKQVKAANIRLILAANRIIHWQRH
jgi:hypothetical protein